MLWFLVRRILSAIPVLLIVSIVTFMIIWIVPGDVTAEFAGPDASPEQIEQLRHQLGLDRPLLERALLWYGNLLQGDLGQSYLLDRSVVGAVMERLPVTLSLVAFGLVLSVVLGMALGILAAIRHNSWVDQASMSLALLGLSLPDFWFGLVLIILFGVQLGWLPTGGFVPPTESVFGWLRCMALPAFTLALTQMGVIARMTRSSMLDVLGQDYVRTARAKGMPFLVVTLKHALLNALIPIVTIVGIMTGVMLGGAVVIESVFSLPGVGRLIIGSIQRRDFPIIQGGLLITAATFVFINIAVDVLYGWIDPRVRDER